MTRRRDPLCMPWPREEFLAARGRMTRAMAATRIHHWLEAAAAERGQPVATHIIDMGRLILCDACSAEVTTERVTVCAYGRRVYCDACHGLYHNEWAAEDRAR